MHFIAINWFVHFICVCLVFVLCDFVNDLWFPVVVFFYSLFKCKPCYSCCDSSVMQRVNWDHNIIKCRVIPTVVYRYIRRQYSMLLSICIVFVFFSHILHHNVSVSIRKTRRFSILKMYFFENRTRAIMSKCAMFLFFI